MSIRMLLEPVHLNLTALSLAKMSNGLFLCAESSVDYLLLKYFLYCSAIELGLKASIFSIDSSPAKKREVKDKVRHDLVATYKAFERAFPGTPPLLDTVDVAALAKINDYFKGKGLEYTTIEVIVEMAHGFSGFPPLEDLRAAAAKVDLFLRDNHFFRDC